MKCRKISSVFALSVASAIAGHAAEIATYTFNNSLAANQSGVASLTAVDPLGTSGFTTDTVFGNSRTVYHFDGNASPAQQGGLNLDTTGLIAGNDYSAEIVFSLRDGNNAWRRILDSLDRQSDAGLYIDPSNNVDIFPVAANPTGFVPNQYYGLAVTVAPDNTVDVYVDGTLAIATTTTVLDESTNFLNFFLDNTAGSGQGEWSAGNVALIRLFDAPLTSAEVATLARDPFAGTASTSTPEPASVVLMAAGAALLLAKRSRRAA